MNKVITDIFTERDGASWDAGRVLGVVAGMVATFRFGRDGGSLQDFGVCIAAIIAAIAAKNASEKA